MASTVIGVYSDEEIAEIVKKSFGFQALVQEIELNHIPPGVIASAKELGFNL